MTDSLLTSPAKINLKPDVKQSCVNWQTHLCKARFLTAVCTKSHLAIRTVPLQDTQIVIATYLFQNPVTCFHHMTINMQYLSYVLTSLIMNKVAVDVRSSEFCDTAHKTEIWSRNFLCILMYILCVMYSLLSRPTNAQHTHIYIYIYIYISTIFHIMQAVLHVSLKLHLLQADLYSYFATSLAQQK